MLWLFVFSWLHNKTSLLHPENEELYPELGQTLFYVLIMQLKNLVVKQFSLTSTVIFITPNAVSSVHQGVFSNVLFGSIAALP